MDNELNGLNTQQPTEPVASTAGRSKSNDRVTLGAVEAERVSAWLKQLEDSSKGFLSLTKSELVNFLMREHKVELTSKQIQSIRASHYDPIRHLNWLMPRLKGALEIGDAAQIAIFQAEIRGIELSVIAKARAPSDAADSAPPEKRRVKKRGVAIVEDEQNSTLPERKKADST